MKVGIENKTFNKLFFLRIHVKNPLFWFKLFITAKAANVITKKQPSDIKNIHSQIYMAAPCLFPDSLYGSYHLPMQDAIMSVYDLCSATLNRSHVMLIVASTDLFIHKVVIFNSVENLWYFISDLQLEYDLLLNHCRASVAIDKRGKK